MCAQTENKRNSEEEIREKGASGTEGLVEFFRMRQIRNRKK
jgi:hypothetical protein